MPDYAFPQEVIPREDVTPGDLSPPTVIASANLGYGVSYQVYTPAGYDALADLPSIYVTDAHEYVDPRMGSMPTVLDNLIADRRIEPVLAVLIDPRDPETGRNRRESELLSNPAYAAFLAQELVPTIDGAFKTHSAPDRRAILGVSYGGVNAAYCGWAYPKIFHLVAMQSPAFAADETIYGRYATTDKLPLRIFISTGYPWDLDARAMKAILQEKGYDLVYLEVPEGHSWGQWRAQLDDLLIAFFERKA
jgi:enterochelin esterase family protein